MLILTGRYALVNSSWAKVKLMKGKHLLEISGLFRAQQKEE